NSSVSYGCGWDAEGAGALADGAAEAEPEGAGAEDEAGGADAAAEASALGTGTCGFGWDAAVVALGGRCLTAAAEANASATSFNDAPATSACRRPMTTSATITSTA